MASCAQNQPLASATFAHVNFIFLIVGSGAFLVVVDRRGKVVSGKHSIYTHFPKDKNCEICMRTKIRKLTGTAVPRADKFGDLITADHEVLSDNCESRNNLK